MPAQTANEALLDALIRHQTYLLRYSGFVRNRIAAILDASEADIAALIRGRVEGVTGVRTPVELRRLLALQASVTALRNKSWEEAARWLEEEMAQLAYQEPIVINGIVTTVSPVLVDTITPSTRLLKAIALSRPFEGRVLREWSAALRAEDVRRIHASIQLGMVAGETGDQIAARVVGTAKLHGVDGVTEMTRRQVQAVTRTAVQHIANNARAEFMQANADIMTGEVFVATLDSRTTPICRALDGKVYKVGDGPLPPLHMACRSLRVAAFDGERLGQRPAKPVTEKQLLREYGEKAKLPRQPKSRDALPRGHKGAYDEFSRKRIRELTGRVPSGTSFQPWLKAQSKQFQEDLLGVKKAKLFRDGNLTLDKFVAPNGRELTLAELAKRHPDAFRAAGMDPAAFPLP